MMHASTSNTLLPRIQCNALTRERSTYPEYAGNVFLVGVDDVSLGDGTNFELFVSHVDHLTRDHTRLALRAAPSLCDVVKEQLQQKDCADSLREDGASLRAGSLT